MSLVDLPFAECPRCHYIWYWLPRRGRGVVGGWWYHCQHCAYPMQRADLGRDLYRRKMSEHDARNHNGALGGGWARE